MSDSTLDELDAVDSEVHAQSGGVFLLKWLGDTWGDAAKGVVTQV